MWNPNGYQGCQKQLRILPCIQEVPQTSLGVGTRIPLVTVKPVRCLWLLPIDAVFFRATNEQLECCCNDYCWQVRSFGKFKVWLYQHSNMPVLYGHCLLMWFQSPLWKGLRGWAIAAFNTGGVYSGVCIVHDGNGNELMLPINNLTEELMIALSERVFFSTGNSRCQNYPKLALGRGLAEKVRRRMLETRQNTGCVTGNSCGLRPLVVQEKLLLQQPTITISRASEGPGPASSESWGQRAVCKWVSGVKAIGHMNHMGRSQEQKGYLALRATWIAEPFCTMQLWLSW